MSRTPHSPDHATQNQPAGRGAGEGAHSFHCTQCGTCCRWPGFVYLSAVDIRRLAAHWHLPDEPFIDQYTLLAPNRGQLCLQTAPDGACIFLQQNRCLCYEARPDQCRQYPSLWAPPDGCPGFSAAPPALNKPCIEKN